MTQDNEILDVLQADMVAVLKSCSGLQDAYIFTGDEKDLDTRLQRTFATRTNSDQGKRGLGIHVIPLMVDKAERNLPGPPLLLRCQIICVENMTLNRGSHGTGVSTSRAALTVLGALHHRMFGPLTMYADADPVKPEPADNGLSAHIVTLYCRANGIPVAPRCASITPTIAEDVITLTTATADAEIRFTTDGKYPDKDSGTLYAAPFDAPAAGSLIRSVATAADMNPSDLVEFTITA